MSTPAADIILKYLPDFDRRHCGRLYPDTTEFMSIDYGDVIPLNGRHYLVLRHEAERKFGLEDPKYWVKRCRELETNTPCILKLVFHESFEEKIGSITVTSFRSETKEARILDLVRGDVRFMQGFSHPDTAGNIVRVLEIIRGRRADEIISKIEADHETYFHEQFPGLLQKYLGCCQAIGFLHENGEKHGDVRNDHIWVETSTGEWRWIDFDYTFDYQENPFGLDLFGLGNILLFLVGKGIHTRADLERLGLGPEVAESLTEEDHCLVFRSRIANLKKLFPYIPEALNRVLMRFARGTHVFYESVPELMDDLTRPGVLPA